MPTTVIHTIKPAGGGDYTSLNAWEVAQRRNLTTADEIEVAEVYSGGNSLTSTLSINTGWTTDATRYVEIRAASGEEHTGVYSTAKAYAENNTANADIISIAKDVHLTKMQFNTTTTGGGTTVGLISLNGSGAKLTMDRCFTKSTGDFINVNLFLQNSATATVKNCVIINRNTTDGFTALCGKIFSTSILTVYNNTFVAIKTGGGSTAGLQASGSGTTVTSQNNYLIASSANRAYWNLDTATFNMGANDATSNADATTANLRNIPYSTATFQNVTLGSENLRLTVSGSNKLLDHGADLSGSGVTTDIIGTARPQFAAFDIGAFENDIPVCWNYTARYKNSNKLFKASGCGSFPKTLRVPNNVDVSTGRMIDDGIEIDPRDYRIV